MSEYDAAIARGVELLDTAVPDWRKRVDPKRLHLADCKTCVLGQVFGDFDTGLDTLGVAWPDDYGFALPNDIYDGTRTGNAIRNQWGWLTRKWRKVLA